MKGLQKILEFKLLDVANIKLSVYHLLLVSAIIFTTWLVLFIVTRLLNRRWGGKKTTAWGREYSLFQILKYFIWIFMIIMALDTIGVKVTFFLAGSAALLVGVGLGLQQTFNDIVSGIIILWEGSININDVVEIEGTVGRIRSIGLRTSQIRTRDNITIIIPNSKFVVDRVINWSHSENLTRFHVNVGVAYGSDISKVRKVLLKCAEDHGKIASSPSPFVRFLDFGNSSLDFQIFFWAEDSFGVENLKSDLRFIIEKQFRENNISIPFPQRDLYLKSWPDGTSVPISNKE